MALRTIVTEPDELLRKRSRPVEKFDERLWQLLDDMKDTLIKADGVGPVSYTHLDVYKRQNQCCRHNKTEQSGNPFSFHCLFPPLFLKRMGTTVFAIPPFC